MEKVSVDSLFDEPEDIKDTLSKAEENLFLEATQIGSGSETFNVLGHEVKLHTLTIEETLKAAQVVKKYSDTEANWLAVKTSITAAAIDEIDSIPFYVPVAISDPIIPAKFKKLANEYYSQFVNEVYNSYKIMENKQIEIIDKIKKAQA